MRGDARRDRRASRASIRERPEVQERLRQRRTLLGSGSEVRKATLIINLVPKEKRKLAQAADQGGDRPQISRDVPDIRFWFLQDNGQRQFQLVVTGRDGAAVDDVGGRADQPGQAHAACSPTSSRRPSSTGPSCASCRTPTSPPSSASRPKPSPRPCASPPSATSAPTSPSSTSATARCRSACSSTESARGDRQLLEPLKVATAVGRGRAAVGRGHASSSARARPPSTATTACAASLIGADLVGKTPLGDAVDAVLALPAAKNLPRGRRDQAVRRRRDHGRGVRELRQGHGRRHHDGVRRAGAAVRQLPAAGHHPVLAAAVDRRRHRRAGHHRAADQPAGRDRHPDADGHRHQERHHARRLRRRGDARAACRAPRPSSMPAASARGRSS